MAKNQSKFLGGKRIIPLQFTYMKLRILISATIFILSLQILGAAQTFELPAFLEETQTVAGKTAYQAWVEFTSDFKITETDPNEKKNTFSYETLCSRKSCASILIAINDKRFSEKKIDKNRKKAAKTFIKAENKPDNTFYTEKENSLGYGISINNWFSPSLYLRFCQSEFVDKSLINERQTVKIKVADCDPEKINKLPFPSRLNFMTKTEGLIWIDEQDKAIIKMEIFAKKEFPNLSNINKPLVIIEAGKVAENYWFWRSIRINALENKAIFPEFKKNIEYEFYNYRLPNVEIKNVEVDKK